MLRRGDTPGPKGRGVSLYLTLEILLRHHSLGRARGPALGILKLLDRNESAMYVRPSLWRFTICTQSGRVWGGGGEGRGWGVVVG